MLSQKADRRRNIMTKPRVAGALELRSGERNDITHSHAKTTSTFRVESA
jgi:hypothetical protein